MAEMENDIQELQSVSDSVAEYFCEDPSKFKLDECCSIFNSFCEKFLRAIQVSVSSGKFSSECQKQKEQRPLTSQCHAGKQGSRGGRGSTETQRQIAVCCQAKVHRYLFQQGQGNGRSCLRVRAAELPQQSCLSEETWKTIIFSWKPYRRKPQKWQPYRDNLAGEPPL